MGRIFIGGAYSNKFLCIRIGELVLWDDFFIRVGVRSRSNEAMYSRWHQGANYDVYIEKYIR